MIFKKWGLDQQLFGPAVAALGSIAGGMAAKALGADKGKGPTNGGGIPGLTSSKGQGKDGTGPGYATQVDPTKAIDYFKQAAAAQSSGYNEGLSYYGTALDQAKTEISAGYQKANATLQPLSYSSNQALNEQMRMLGLDPIQATASYGDALQAGYDTVKSGLNPAVGEQVSTLISQLNAATNIKDPADRATYREQILQQINATSGQMVSDAQGKLNAIAQPKMPAPFAMYKEGDRGADGHLLSLDEIRYHNANTGTYDYQPAMTQYQSELDKYNADRAAAQTELDNANAYSANLQKFGSQFAQNYGDQYDGGYSPDQIINKVSQLPGYQFNLNQGTKAIERQGAAAGMLGSGNTLTALQTYGQGQAQSYYNQYMGYLSGITSQGAPATAQISANQAAEGTALATLTQNYGQAQMDTARANANFLAKTLQDSGILFNNTAMFNASAQNASILQANQNQNQLAQQAIQSGPGYMNAQTNAGTLQLASQQQNWNQQQAQQTANAYLGRGQSGYGWGGGLI